VGSRSAAPFFFFKPLSAAREAFRGGAIPRAAEAAPGRPADGGERRRGRDLAHSARHHQHRGPDHSYGRTNARGAGDGNRTHVTSLEGWRTTIVLRPRQAKGATGRAAIRP